MAGTMFEGETSAMSESVDSETDATPAPEPEARVETAPEERIAALEAALQEARSREQTLFNDLLRARAELDNVRKRAQKDVENAHRYGLEKLVQEFLPVKDGMDMGTQAADQAVDPVRLREGMDLTQRMLATALEKCGVRPVDPAGERFDPNLHEAIGTEAAPGTPAGTVLRVVQKGYQLNDRLIRPALVVVAQ